MQRRLVLFWAGACTLPALGQARVPVELVGEWPLVRLQGQARFRFLGLHVYDIRLWTAAAALPAEDWARTPLALEIEYGRSLAGRSIAERSMQEMRRGGTVSLAQSEHWLMAMTRLFPDVQAGDRITGLHRPGRGAWFHVNGRERGEVADAEFASRFFGIWLAPSTSEPDLRAALLGLK